MYPKSRRNREMKTAQTASQRIDKPML